MNSKLYIFKGNKQGKSWVFDLKTEEVDRMMDFAPVRESFIVYYQPEKNSYAYLLGGLDPQCLRFDILN